MSTRTYKIQVLASLVIGLAVIGAASWVASQMLPPPASCVESSRNPYRFRGWPEYLGGMDAASEVATVVLISNSQGYAGEYPAKRGYPARLETLLNERRTGGHARWEVLNLSLDGVTTPDYMASAARLRDERPLWLITVAGYADFRAENYEKGFGYCRSDLPRLLTEWRHARRLPWSFWRRHGKMEDTLTAWVAHRFPLLRIRDYLWSWLDTRYPGAQWAFYAPRTTHHFWQVPGKARTAPPARPGPDPKLEKLDLTYDARSTEMLNEFVAQLAAIPAAHKLAAVAPMNSLQADIFGVERTAAFRRDLASATAKQGVPFQDWSETLPTEDFIAGNHFHDRNHRRMAEQLADHIAAEMGR